MGVTFCLLHDSVMKNNPLPKGFGMKDFQNASQPIVQKKVTFLKRWIKKLNLSTSFFECTQLLISVDENFDNSNV